MAGEQKKRQKRINNFLYLGLVLLAAFYLLAIFAEFLAPYPYQQQVRGEPSAPLSTLHFRDSAGKFHAAPFIYTMRLTDPLTMNYAEDITTPYRLEFLAHGSSYKFLGVFSSDLHLFGVTNSNLPEMPRLRLLGSDELGRDRFSRLAYAVRFSLIVSPIGTILACVLGVFIGVVSGYAPKILDTILMGAADTMLSLPTLILILAARAAFPLELPMTSAALLLIVIFALTGWAEIARLARGLVVSMREREFVLAAKASGLTQPRILFRHIFPNIAAPLITQATLMFPAFLLAEVALSFLGVGLQEPDPSLGNMLTAAGDLTRLQSQPFLLLSPAIIIFIFVFAIRLVSNGLKNEKSACKSNPNPADA
ncbi:MAG: ABC transporter permease [Pyrinomonadaceae bacterium]